MLLAEGDLLPDDRALVLAAGSAAASEAREGSGAAGGRPRISVRDSSTLLMGVR
ncbi:hypothetical protein [Streptomyces sp. NBC_01285]|uniref:hypothetical protein n=1 Tax=Streptomyces sp. NBC_01285 TaxID=2903813 RepID=UPI00225BE7EF|nr:hypothetical protein [Streptomyces sp. NBC_01285]MCX4774125.1 hypothetical protein [Streptomyces sp. NBC_01285]